jgi:hypothetical protein
MEYLVIVRSASLALQFKPRARPCNVNSRLIFGNRRNSPVIFAAAAKYNIIAGQRFKCANSGAVNDNNNE